MKRLTFRRWHEKVRWHEKFILAAIILSCGLVMQADPPAHKTKVRNGSELGRNWNSHPGASSPAQATKTAKLQRMRDHVAYP